MIGTQVILKDKQTLRTQMENGGSLKGLYTKVIDQIDVTTPETSWRFLELEDNVWVIIQTVGESKEYSVHFRVDVVPEGNRQDAMDAECDWLFNCDDDVELNELEYADEIYQDDICYKRKLNSFFGESDEVFAQVTEWNTDADIENPELVVLELGDSDEGGLIRFLPGCIVKESDIEFMEK